LVQACKFGIRAPGTYQFKKGESRQGARRIEARRLLSPEELLQLDPRGKVAGINDVVDLRVEFTVFNPIDGGQEDAFVKRFGPRGVDGAAPVDVEHVLRGDFAERDVVIGDRLGAFTVGVDDEEYVFRAPAGVGGRRRVNEADRKGGVKKVQSTGR
jgi:hypothetical protein